MKVCLFTPTFLPKVGGTEYVTDGLARHLTAMGHHAVVLAQGEPVTLDLSYPVHWYPKPWQPRWFPERTNRALAELHEIERFDIVAVNYANPTGYGAVRYGKKVGVPIVVISHGGDLYESSRDRARPHIWKRVVHTYQHADALVAISPYTEQLIRRINPTPPLLERLPNGIDIADLNRPADRPHDINLDEPFMLCLGNLGPMKGFADAISAYASAGEPVRQLRLVIVGAGPLEQELRSAARAAGVADRVLFAGKRIGADKRWFLRNCRFGLMPSIEEGHPIVALEFLAVGKPIICTTIGAFDGMYDHGVNGLRVPVGDVTDLAAAMDRLAGSTELDAMGSRCAERVEQFDWPLIARRYMELFEKVIAARQDGG